jgi:hypothetical protein
MNLKRFAVSLLSSGLPDWAWLRAFYRAMYRGGVFAYETGVWLKKIFVVEPVVRAICRRAGKRLRIERIPYVRGTGQIVLGDDIWVVPETHEKIRHN